MLRNTRLRHEICKNANDPEQRWVIPAQGRYYVCFFETEYFGRLALEEPKMKVLLTTAAVAAMALIPAAASAQFATHNTNTVFGGTVGAGLGGIVGSRVAGSGNRTEGAIIGAAVGGLAGSALANGRSASRYGSTASGFGAPVGGGFVPAGGFGAPVGGGFVSSGGFGAPAGGFVSGPGVVGAPAGFGGAPGFGAPAFGAPVGGFGAPAPLRPGVNLANGGFVSGPVIPVTTSRPRVQQTIVRQRTIQAPPRVIPGRVIQRPPVVVNQPCPSGTTQQPDGTCLSAPRTVHAPAPTVIPAMCPAGTTDMGNGTCQEPAKTVMGAAPIVIPQSCPAGTTDLGNGTCQEPPKTVMGAAPIVIPQSCPAGTTDQGDGTCLEPAKTVMGQAPIVIPAACPSGTTDMGDGTCQEPAKTVMGAAPIVVPQPCPAGTLDLGNGTCEAQAVVVQPEYVPPAPQVVTPSCPTGSYYSQGSCISSYEGGHSVSDTVIHSGEYCYGNGKAVYDSKGRKIKNKETNHASCSGH